MLYVVSPLHVTFVAAIIIPDVVPERDAQRIMERPCVPHFPFPQVSLPYLSNKARSLTETTVTARHPITRVVDSGPHPDAHTPSTYLQGPGGAWNKRRSYIIARSRYFGVVAFTTLTATRTAI